jgi:peptidoglycan hydrolase-like protein with peptidoglycan-binding domain
MVETPTLAVGAQGEEVRKLQQALLDAGIQFRGGADGVFGPATQAALRQFQQQNNLPATGTVDAQTASVLMPVGSGVTRTPEEEQFYQTLPPELRELLDDKEIIDRVNESFGQYAGFLYHPEVGQILLKAAKENYTAQQLRTSLQKTAWWETSSEATRAFDNETALGDETQKVRIEQRKNQIRELVSALGGQLADNQITELATNSLRFGMDERQVGFAVGAEIRKSSSPTDLQMGVIGRELRDTVSRFGIQLADPSINNWAAQIATGEMNMQDFDNYARQQAISLFPSLQRDIERGLDVATIANPYAEHASRVLGINSNQVDFTDPKWAIALNFQDQQGRRAMTLDEWGRYIRSNEQYGYQFTDDAHNKAYAATTTIARAFGRL